MNACCQTAFTNPVDEAIQARQHFALSDWEKIDEVPYDFLRKRLSVLVAHNDETIVITKGAFRNVLDICSCVEVSGEIRSITEMRDQLEQQFALLGDEGFRTLGLAYKYVAGQSHITATDETGMTFLGLLVFFDPPKDGVAEVVDDLNTLGITVKVITGDNAPVATSVARKVLGYEPKVLTGKELHSLSHDQLRVRAETLDVFATA